MICLLEVLFDYPEFLRVIVDKWEWLTDLNSFPFFAERWYLIPIGCLIVGFLTGMFNSSKVRDEEAGDIIHCSECGSYDEATGTCRQNGRRIYAPDVHGCDAENGFNLMSFFEFDWSKMTPWRYITGGICVILCILNTLVHLNYASIPYLLVWVPWRSFVVGTFIFLLNIGSVSRKKAKLDMMPGITNPFLRFFAGLIFTVIGCFFMTIGFAALVWAVMLVLGALYLVIELVKWIWNVLIPRIKEVFG